MELTPFVVDVAQASLDDLRERLARTRWPDEVDGAGWDYGASLRLHARAGRVLADRPSTGARRSGR